MSSGYNAVFGAMLADYILEPFMQREGAVQKYLAIIVGTGHGAGIGLIFVFAGLSGIVMLSILCKNKTIKAMDT